MDEDKFNHIKETLENLTPGLVDDLLNSFKIEPSIAENFDSGDLRTISEHGVVSFINVLIGSIQFNSPKLVSRELNWLGPFLSARSIKGNRVNVFMNIVKKRVQAECRPEDSAFLIKFLKEVKEHLKDPEFEKPQKQ